MTNKTTARRIGTGFAALALAGTALTGSAHAEDVSTKAASDCPSGWFCVWAGEDYKGQMQKVEGNNADLSQFTVFVHHRSNFNNGTSCDVMLYGDKNYKNPLGRTTRGDKNPGIGREVKILSNKWINCR
ncbi:peptidase inhibitor family I36 protein [Streptomyces sp. NPDC050164]|uniref:peptidase inhibitor family I36 protein n=1 Tax=Streptomyces sp. NPDC050164 TaxID=3365605 RepID=UPI0037A5FB60